MGISPPCCVPQVDSIMIIRTLSMSHIITLTLPFTTRLRSSPNTSVLSYSFTFGYIDLRWPSPPSIGIFLKKIKIIPKTVIPLKGHRLESRLRIFWKFALLPFCSVASFCWKSRGSRKMLLLLQFLRYRDAVCSILRTTKLPTKSWKLNFKFFLQIFLVALKMKRLNPLI